MLPPEVLNNRCHIAPEWEKSDGQRIWFVLAPFGGSRAPFYGEPTSLLYAMAPLVQAIRDGEVRDGPAGTLDIRDIALLTPPVSDPQLYEEMTERLSRQNLRMICISSLTCGIIEARRIARLAKMANRNTLTVIGGPHEDDVARKTALDPRFSDIVDVSVSGEGEFSLLELARIAMEHHDMPVPELKRVIAGRSQVFAASPGTGAISMLVDAAPATLNLSGARLDLNALPLMPRELLHELDTKTFSVFRREGRRVKTAQIMTHRGCAWRCSFCSESPVIRTRSVESVVAEVESVLHFSDRARSHGLVRENYGAVFFDDSTFTGGSKKRQDFLNELLPKLARLGVEWGCQTRLDQLTEERLQAMKHAGCTYMYVGLESASEEMLRAMVKDQGLRDIQPAFEAAQRVGMRLGISLIFGVAERGSHATTETHETISETLNYVQRLCNGGNIQLVSPNIATYYPDTQMTRDRDRAIVSLTVESTQPRQAQDSAASHLDFSNPFVNRGYPWNRFEEGESFHPFGVSADLAKFILQYASTAFGEFLVNQDIYSFDDYQEALWNDEFKKAQLKCVNLNHASISLPSREARQAAKMCEQSLPNIGSHAVSDRIEAARVVAARLMGLSKPDSDHVVFARNTTEAISFSYWLAGLGSKTRPRIVLTTAENMSVHRAFRLHMDHGNSHGRDPWSSFQNYGVKTQGRHIPVTPTNADIVVADVLDQTSPEDAILRQVDPATQLVVFSHVTRDHGTILEVKELCAEIRRRSPNTFIMVDGAQALGALPRVHPMELGCDFYAGTPHKTLGALPLGVLYVSDRAKANIHHLVNPDKSGYPLLGGCVSPSLESKRPLAFLSLPEMEGFNAACQVLEEEGLIRDSNCWQLYTRRTALRKELARLLTKRFDDVEIASPLDNRGSSFILSFRFRNADNRLLTSRLWSDRAFVSYISRSDVIRTSFGTSNVMDDIRQFVDLLGRSVHALRDRSYREVG